MNPMVETVGKLDDYPREQWGTRDDARAAREERARAQVKAMTRQSAREFEPLPGPASDFSVFTLDPPRRPRHQSARSNASIGCSISSGSGRDAAADVVR